MAKNEINMTEGPLFGKIVRFSLPVMLSSILQLLFNAVDTVVVGQFIGDEALAAVGSTGSLINLIIGLFVGIPTGTTVLVAQFYGAKREKDVSEVVHTSALTAIIFGLFLTLVGQLFCRLFLEWTNVPEDVIDLAERYLRIYFLGCPVMLLYNFLAAALRAIGDTKRPLIYLTIGSAVNLAFNLLFVIVFRMNVEGVAIPTVMSQAVSAVLVTICLFREKGIVRLSMKDLKIHWDKFWRILKIGVPAGLQSVAFSISNVIVQASLNSFGKLAMAGGTAAGNLESFIGQSTNAFALAAISFTAQNAGAKKYQRINGVFWRIALLVTVIGVAMGVGIYLAGPELLRIYTSTPESIDAGLEKLSIAATTHFLGSLMQAATGMLKGLGSTTIPMAITLLGTCVGRILYISTVFQKYHTLTALYAVYPISWGATAIVLTVFFFFVFARYKKRHGPEES